MSKKSRRRRRRSRKKPQTRVVTADPQELFDKRDYTGAARLLRVQIEKEPTDDQRRMLGKCLVQLNECQEAAMVFLDIEDKNWLDLAHAGWCFAQIENWGSAIQRLEESLQLKEHPETYYWLAFAYAEGRLSDYELNKHEGTKSLVVELLRKAVALPECRIGAFLWLEELTEDTQQGVEILQEALTRYPHSKRTRLALAKLLGHRLGNFDQAQKTLDPLLTTTDSGQEVFWYAFLFSCNLDNYVAALNYLDAMYPSPEDRGVGLAKIKGDVLLKLNKISEAVACYDEEIEGDDLEAQLVGLFSRAWARLVSELHFYRPSSVWIGGDLFLYDYAECIEQVCTTLLQYDENEHILSDELKGRLSYLLYDFYNSSNGDALGDLLLRAAQLSNHPKISQDLSYHLAEAGDLPLAIHHHLIHCLWKYGKRDILEEFPSFWAEFDYDEDLFTDNAGRTQTHRAALTHFEACDDEGAIRAVFLPFYRSFWRGMLLDGGMFTELANVNRHFLEVLQEEGNCLWDYALGLQHTGDLDEAERTYRQYLGRHPKCASTLHNLSIILNEKGSIQEAFELSSEAVELNPDDELIAKRYRRLKANLDQQKAIQDRIDNSPLTAGRQRELDDFYWQTNISTAELKDYFDLPKAVHFYVTPLLSDTICPTCDWRLVYKSRTSKSSGDKCCENCGHSEAWFCRCQYCTNIREEKERQRKEELSRQKRAAFKARLEQVSSKDYIIWAVSQLNRREKIFARAFVEVVAETKTPTWGDISDRAKVVSHKKYVNKLLQLGLLLEHPDGGIIANPSLSLNMVEVQKSVRRISKSLRFDVFQRDNHTCQYCGRKAPDVELEVDHLVPVAQGGTDEFDNLMTSCKECNSGKSAKLVKEFTKGHTINEWRAIIRQKRVEILRKRRAQLTEVMEYWAECRGTKSVSEYDAGFIRNFIERYEPEWIKAAVSIASKKRPSNYGKYVAGILRNWGKNGPPDYIGNPDSHLDSKKATTKQIDYIKGLLDSLGLELDSFYHESDFEQLTMLDARNLIEELTQSVPEDNTDI
jgi:tetratricopeptide (TPR) repeat protein